MLRSSYLQIVAGLCCAAWLAACGTSSSESPPDVSDAGSDGGGQVPSKHKDGVQNGDETDIDCGGATAPKCAVTSNCVTNTDCSTNSCIQKKCRTISASNGIKDGEETDIDCGGTAAPKCQADKTCAAPADCLSLVCNANRCSAPTPNDGVKNADETDVDCGGTAAPACAANKSCDAPSDCADKICTSQRCVVGTHTDNVKNLNETGVDCGGGTAPKCDVGQTCVAGTDCVHGACISLVCTAPSYTDGVKNGAETDIDCGGDAVHSCADNKSCLQPTDCVSTRCVANQCAPQTHSDGVKNLGESDIDCGGVIADAAGQAPRCAAKKTCAAHSDCASDGCNPDTWTCASARSCAQTRGGQTCGISETGDNNRKHESCCETVNYNRPAGSGGAFTIDKYVITAGRMRQFFQRTGGNVAAYMQSRGDWAAFQARWGASLVSHLPTNLTEAEHLVDGTAWQTWEWKGANWPTIAYEISGFGCYDAHTYYVAGDAYTQAFNDEKMLNCVHGFMIDAFCRWDGGQIWDDGQAFYAWNNADAAVRRFPWGDNPAPLVSPQRFGDDPTNPVHELLVHKWNYPYVGGELAFMPGYVNGGNSYQIPPPGRRPKGYARAGAYSAADPLVGTADMAGGLYQLLWLRSGGPGTLGSGSYEVHDIGTYGYSGGWQINRRYAAAGGRCAR